MTTKLKPHQDPNHPGNRIRPEVRCRNCGTLGCTTQWGPWCFDCNVKRMDRIDAAFAEVERRYGMGKEVSNT